MSVYNRFLLLRYILFIQSQGIDAREGMTIIGAQLITPSKYVPQVFYSTRCNYISFQLASLPNQLLPPDFSFPFIRYIIYMFRYTHTHTYAHSSVFFFFLFIIIIIIIILSFHKVFSHGTKFYDSKESLNLALIEDQYSSY